MRFVFNLTFFILSLLFNLHLTLAPCYRRLSTTTKATYYYALLTHLKLHFISNVLARITQIVYIDLVLSMKVVSLVSTILFDV